MAKLPQPLHLFLCFTFFSSLFFINSIPMASGATEVENEREFDYKVDGERGSSRWGEIHPEWHSCSNGTMQSPIDLLDENIEVVSHLGRLNRSYKAANATLVNRGHDMMLRFEGGAGSLYINGSEYVLQQCHWHSPSEHTINGKRYAMEAHMVHESSEGKIAVVGILYTIGSPDSFLQSMKDHLLDVAGKEEEETSVGVRNPRDLRIGSRKYFRYIGSLTVPPCTENVTWTIARKVRTVSREQLRLLRVAVHDDSNTNARSVQPKFGRKVKLFRPDN